MWNEITYPFPNINGCAVGVWGWTSNSNPHFYVLVITYPCPYLWYWWRSWRRHQWCRYEGTCPGGHTYIRSRSSTWGPPAIDQRSPMSSAACCKTHGNGEGHLVVLRLLPTLSSIIMIKSTQISSKSWPCIWGKKIVFKVGQCKQR